MSKKIFYPILGTLLLGSAIALTVERASVEELTTEASIIVYGRVLSVESVWENPGKIPGNINTFIDVQVLEAVKGNSEDRISVRQMGGKIGEFEDVIVGTPRFREGEEVLLFLVQHEGYWEIHSIALGAYRIFTDESGTNRAYNDFTAVNVIDPATGKQILYDPAENNYELDSLIGEIRSYLSR